MATSLIRTVQEAPDGMRTVFTTHSPFRAGTVRVVLNGLWQQPSYHIELGNTAVELPDAPFPDDSVETYYTAL